MYLTQLICRLRACEGGWISAVPVWRQWDWGCTCRYLSVYVSLCRCVCGGVVLLGAWLWSWFWCAELWEFTSTCSLSGQLVCDARYRVLVFYSFEILWKCSTDKSRFYYLILCLGWTECGKLQQLLLFCISKVTSVYQLFVLHHKTLRHVLSSHFPSHVEQKSAKLDFMITSMLCVKWKVLCAWLFCSVWCVPENISIVNSVYGVLEFIPAPQHKYNEDAFTTVLPYSKHRKERTFLPRYVLLLLNQSELHRHRVSGVYSR